MGYDHPGLIAVYWCGSAQVGWNRLAVGVMNSDDLRFNVEVVGRKSWDIGWRNGLV